MENHFGPLSRFGFKAIACSAPMRQLFDVVERVAQSNVSILIRGETGSGKELLARAIHQTSLRCNKPWVDVNCAALPEHLIESELFGYEKGAFSGADHPKQGLFELANTGTLFLDEVGELEPRMQVKLLRVLDGVPFYRLGGTRKVAVDARVIAATNQPLEDAISAGEFRRDLYHRLAQVELHVPPLREHPEDIVPLAEMFLAEDHPDKYLSCDSLQALEKHSWPGNVRELRNAVTRAALLARSDCILPADLPIAPQMSPIQTLGIPPAFSLEESERKAIQRALDETDGHHQRAALLLGISRRTLARKLKQYGDSDVTSTRVSRPVPAGA